MFKHQNLNGRNQFHLEETETYVECNANLDRKLFLSTGNIGKPWLRQSFHLKKKLTEVFVCLLDREYFSLFPAG